MNKAFLGVWLILLVLASIDLAYRILSIVYLNQTEKEKQLFFFEELKSHILLNADEIVKMLVAQKLS